MSKTVLSCKTKKKRNIKNKCKINTRRLSQTPAKKDSLLARKKSPVLRPTKIASSLLPIKTIQNQIIQNCSDSNNCVLFGLEQDKLNLFFNDFKNFDNADLTGMKKIGGNASNGFIYEIPFEKDNMKTHVILKSSTKISSDNLVYEGYVGYFLNEYSMYLPCFVKTYAIGNYTDNTLYSDLVAEKSVSKELLNTLKIRLPLPKFTIEDLNKSCIDPLSKCVITEHLKKIVSISTLYRKSIMDLPEKTKENYLNTTFIQYLYQVYSCLDTMKNIYTHYDLHGGNVQVYFPSKNKKGKYIVMRYHYSDGSTVEFATEGIVKIIDYGRSYFYKDETNNSHTLYRNICKIASCKPNCGNEKGFMWMGKKNRFAMDSSRRNISHDLRLFMGMKVWKEDVIKEKIMNESDFGPKTQTDILFEKLEYGTHLTEDEKYIGTYEKLENGYPKKIVNVSDLHNCLRDILLSPSFQQDELILQKTKMGEMDIWLDGSKPIQYVASL